MVIMDSQTLKIQNKMFNQKEFSTELGFRFELLLRSLDEPFTFDELHKYFCTEVRKVQNTTTRRHMLKALRKGLIFEVPTTLRKKFYLSRECFVNGVATLHEGRYSPSREKPNDIEKATFVITTYRNK